MITYQEEPFEELWPDMQSLLTAHWEEVGSMKEFPLNIDYDLFVNLENQGGLLCTSARDDNKLVGYMVDFIRYHVHYKDVKVAITDAYYIHPDYRAKCGRGLLRFTEKIEKEMEVYSRVTRSKSANNAGKFFELMGYNQAETTWIKRL